jgi:general stress protein 26
MTKEFLFEFIKQNKFAVVSTISVNQMPQSACVGIAVTPDLKLLFDTTMDSRKYENLMHTPRVSFVIGWENAITVQYEGIAVHIPKDSIDEKFNTYFEEFPDGLDRNKNWKNITYFMVEPTWIRYSDFNEVVPKIDEMHF